MADKATLEVYARKTEDYAKTFIQTTPDKDLCRFMDALAAGARVLDLGCGTGQTLAFMRDAGFDAEGMDASPEMAAHAKVTFDLDVTVAPFEDLRSVNRYDGIYANFSLLHAPKADMPGHLAAIARALKPGGLLHLGLKCGDGESRDRLGRFYAYYQDEELTDLLIAAGFTVLFRRFGEEAGLAGTVEPFMILLARKNT